MTALSKEEKGELDQRFSESQLGQDQKTILAHLAEVYHNNLQNPWVDSKTLGTAIGGESAELRAEVAALGLLHRDLISRSYHRKNRETMYAISDKGLAYINSNKKQYIVSHKRPSRKLLWGIIIPLTITIVGGVIVALITGWRPW
jgi:hypothetical protein